MDLVEDDKILLAMYERQFEELKMKMKEIDHNIQETKEKIFSQTMDTILFNRKDLLFVAQCVDRVIFKEAGEEDDDPHMNIVNKDCTRLTISFKGTEFKVMILKNRDEENMNIKIVKVNCKKSPHYEPFLIMERNNLFTGNITHVSDVSRTIFKECGLFSSFADIAIFNRQFLKFLKSCVKTFFKVKCHLMITCESKIYFNRVDEHGRAEIDFS